MRTATSSQERPGRLATMTSVPGVFASGGVPDHVIAERSRRYRLHGRWTRSTSSSSDRGYRRAIIDARPVPRLQIQTEKRHGTRLLASHGQADGRANVSHANNKTKRRFLPNLQYRRFWVEGENRWVRLRITNAALRLIDKVGIEQVVADLRARGEI